MKNLVDGEILKALKVTASVMLRNDAKLRKAWLDQNQTSRASNAAGGILKYNTGHDWALAFFVWHHGYCADNLKRV